MDGGYLYKRGAVWWGRVRRGSQELRRSLRTGSRAEAKRRLEAWSEEIDRGAFYGEHRHTWEEAAGRYISEVMPESVKPATAKRYLISLKQIRPLLDNAFLDRIDRKKVSEIARRPGVSNATRRRDLTAMSAVLRACCAWGWRDDNPAKEWDRSVIRERRDPIQPPSAADVTTFIAACPPMFGRLVRFLAETGMRQEEAASLEWRQIDPARSQASLYTTKTSKPRVVALTSPGGDARGTIEGTPRSLAGPYVFWPRPDGRFANVPSRFREIMKRVQAAEKAAKRPFRPFRCHDLRHGFAINWLTNGGDIYQLSRHLGHSSVKTTEIYLGYVSGAQKGAQTI